MREDELNVKQVDRRIKKRRDERIRSLQSNHSPWPAVPRSLSSAEARSTTSLRPVSSRERRRKRRGKLGVQALIAFLLLTFTYVVFQSESPTAKDVQAFITEVMQRDYNFQGVAQWLEAHLGSMPAIIPTFSRNDATREKGLQSTAWALPVQGEVVERYGEGHPYVTLSTLNGQVSASAEGLVAFVGEREGWGTCIIVQHAGDMETWYGPLSDVEVEQSDWVQGGQLLGQATALEGTVQFGMKRGGQFVDPQDVMRVD